MAAAATAPASRFLDPAALAALRDLQLIARAVVEGTLAGLHRDARSGVGAEFEQYRAYQPGDDPRRIDWRAVGRSDRYLVREAAVERDVTVRFVLDTSASMAHAESAGQGLKVTKFDVARMLVASLAYLADAQGDVLALQLPPAGASVPLGRARQLRELLHHLENATPTGAWPSWESILAGLGRRRGRELVVLVSDLWEGEEEIRGAVRALRALGHEILVFHLLGRAELDFAWEGDVLFEDLETGTTVEGNAAELRTAYLAQLEEELGAWRRDLLELGASYARVVLDEPLEHALREFLLRRQQLP